MTEEIRDAWTTAYRYHEWLLSKPLGRDPAAWEEAGKMLQAVQKGQSSLCHNLLAVAYIDAAERNGA